MMTTVRVGSFAMTAACCAVISLMLLVTDSHAFSPILPPTRSTNNVRSSASRSIMAAGSDEDEIAALEAQLAALKEKKEAEERDDDVATDTTTEEEPRKWAVKANSRFAAPPSGSAADENGDPFAEMLSESWKETADAYETKKGEETASALATVGKIVAGLVALVVFAQIPIGQADYDKYSAARPNMSIDLGDLNRTD